MVEDKEKVAKMKEVLSDISKRNRELDGRADYHKGLRMERNRILKLIESDIEDQKSRKINKFTAKNNAIAWRIEGMELLISRIRRS